MLTLCLVAQAGLNDEKTGGRKSRWTVPLKVSEKRQKYRELSVSGYYHLLLLLLFLLCYLSVCSVSTRPILGAMKIVSRIFHKNLIFAKASISYFQHLLATKKRKMSRNLLRIYVATLMCTVYIQYLTSPSQALMILIHPSSSGPTGRLLEVVVLHILRDGVYYAKMPSLPPIRRLRQNRTPCPVNSHQHVHCAPLICDR